MKKRTVGGISCSKSFFGVLVAVISLITGISVLAGETTGLQRISEHVFAYVDVKDLSPANSMGANSGIIVGRNGVMVVDTLISAREGTRLLRDIRKVTDKPIKYIVNTHYHLDHAWGNDQLTKVGAVVIAQDNSRKNFPRGVYGLEHHKEFGLTDADVEGTVLQIPTLTFSQAMTIDLGGVTVELKYLGPAHTDDSITVFIPQDKVLFVGDILFTGCHPFLGEGDIGSWVKILNQLEQVPAEKIIPGHGPISGKSELKVMAAYLVQFDALARQLCKGKQAADAPAIAQEILKQLPDQQRTGFLMMPEANLRVKYLPTPKTEQPKSSSQKH